MQLASKGKIPTTEAKAEETTNGFLGNLIDQASFVQDLLIMIGTILEEVQKSIHILSEESRKRILKVANKLTIKSKKRREEAKIQRLLKKEEPISLSDLDSTSSEEDETIFTNAMTVQEEEVLEAVILEEPM